MTIYAEDLSQEAIYEEATMIVDEAMENNPTIPEEAREDLIREEVENINNRLEAQAEALRD